MSDKPILFSGPMVRAILEGRKTQTRRLISIRGHQAITEFGPSDTAGYDWRFRDAKMIWHDLRHAELMPRLPYATGDRVWVRENWRVDAWNYQNSEITLDYSDGPQRSWLSVEDTDMLCRLIDQSRADAKKAGRSLYDSYNEYSWSPGDSPCRWRPSIHMPRWASRLTLIVEDVRVERLQDISEADAVAEGVEPREITPVPGDGSKRTWWFGTETGQTTAKAAFHALWDSLNAKRAPWAINPWVVAVTFRAVQANIDRMEAEA